MKTSPEKHLIIVWIFIIIGFLIWLIAGFAMDGNMVMFWIGFAVFATGFVYGIFKVRCPSCGRLLLFGKGEYKYCPECGKKLK